MTIVPLILLAASLARAGDAPVGAPGVAALKERFLSATDDAARGKTLDQIAQTTPVTAQDVSALFDLFSRYPDATLRRRVMDSVARLKPDEPQLEPLFLTYLRQEEPEAQLFGINGAFRLRSREALPLVRKIAERKIKAPSASSINALSERNAWWTQYEALSALAQWEGDKSLSLLDKKAKESPAIARLLGQFFWTRTLPRIAAWSRSSAAVDRERAVEASKAAIEPAEAKATRADMLALVRDAKADDEVRHQLALKVGAVSDDAQTGELVREHDAAKDGPTRLLWAAAVFQSPSQESVPLLTRYARESPDDQTRAGARALLVDRVGEARAAELLKDEKNSKK